MRRFGGGWGFQAAGDFYSREIFFSSFASVYGHVHYQVHTSSGCEKREAHNKWSMVKPEKAAPVTGTTLRTTVPAPSASRQ